MLERFGHWGPWEPAARRLADAGLLLGHPAQEVLRWEFRLHDRAYVARTWVQHRRAEDALPRGGRGACATIRRLLRRLALPALRRGRPVL